MNVCGAVIRILRIKANLLCKGNSSTNPYPCSFIEDILRLFTVKHFFEEYSTKMVWATIFDEAEEVNVDTVFYVVFVDFEVSYWWLFVCSQMQGAKNVPGQQLTALAAATHMDHMCTLDIDSKASYVRLSGIICTIGNYMHHLSCFV